MLWAFLVSLLAIIGVDVYLFASHQRTISEALHSAAKAYPIVAAGIGLLMGVLLGHWFWPLC